MKTCIIFNPKAGSAGDAEELIAHAQSFPDCSVELTTGCGAATQLAREAAENGCELVVAAGGDGTLNEVVNGIADHVDRVSLGLLPLGTGNDFARILSLPSKVEECFELLHAGETKAFDLVRVSSDQIRYFINVSAGGFSGTVNEKLTVEMKQSWGPLAYLRCAAAALPELEAFRTEMTLDNGTPLALSAYNIVVGNGRFVAGGIPIAPQAVADDGLLDIIVIPELPAAELALIAAQVLVGTHLENEKVIFRRAAKVSFQTDPGMWFNVDGELVGNQPASFEVLPRAIRIVIGG